MSTFKMLRQSPMYQKHSANANFKNDTNSYMLKSCIAFNFHRGRGGESSPSSLTSVVK
jgi:surface antigen